MRIVLMCDELQWVTRLWGGASGGGIYLSQIHGFLVRTVSYFRHFPADGSGD